VACVQFALSTGHVITMLIQLIRGFVDVPVTSSGSSSSLLYLLDQTTPEHIAPPIFYITNSLVGDAILIWRLWVIWGRNLSLCIPFVVLCIASGVTGYTALVNLSRISPTDTGTVFLPRVHNLLLATWTLSVATQFGATVLIGYRILKAIRWSSKGIRASRLSVLWIVVESGALYSVTTIFLLGFSSTNTGAIFANSLGQISALGPTLIIVRAGLKGSSSFTPVKGSVNNLPSRSNPEDIESGSRSDDTMMVHVRKATEVRLDDLVRRDDGGFVTVSDETSGSPKSRAYASDYSEL